MRVRHLLPALMLGAGLLIVPTAADTSRKPDAEKADTKKIDKLVEQLGSETFAERKKASEVLDTIGEPALEALRKATRSEDTEVRKRATELVTRIEKRVVSARILTAKQVHLVFKAVPLTEAVEELGKKTGYKIRLHDPDGKLKDRKITLDTGKTTFWNALNQFCQKAGLVDGDPNRAKMPVPLQPGARPRPIALPGGGNVPVVAPPPAKKDADKKDTDKKEAEKKEAAQANPKPALVLRPAIAAQIKPGAGPAILPPQPAPPLGGLMPVNRWVNIQPGEIILMPGKPAQKAVDTTTSIRVRPADRKMAGNLALPDKDHHVVVLEVSPEPRIRWQRLLSVKIDKAVDDNDQKLAAIDVQAGLGNIPGGIVIGIGGPGGMAAPARVWMPMGMWSATGLYQYAPVKLKKGDKATKSLKELSGTISAEVLTEAEQMLVADNLLKPTGKSIKGKKGGSLTINTANEAKDGTITIEFEMEMPADVVPETQVNIPIPAAALPNVRPLPPVKAPPLPPLPVPDKKEVKAPAVKGAKAEEKPAPPKPPVAGGGIAILPPGGALGRPMMPMMMRYAVNGLTLQDKKGNPIFATISFNWTKGGGGVVINGGPMQRKLNYILVYRPLKATPAVPSKLVFTARQVVPISVPFKLENVEVK